MLSSSQSCVYLSISLIPSTLFSTTQKIRFNSTNFRSIKSLNFRANLKSPNSTTDEGLRENSKPRVLLNSLRVLEWDKLCDAVSSFAGTSLGRQASKLWALDQTYEESLWLLKETNAAVEIHKHSSALMEFGSIDAHLVKSAIGHARRYSPVSGQEAIAVAVLLKFAEALQINIKAAIKQNADMHDRFMPLVELILDWVINKSVISYILRVVDEDGSIKDSASGKLQQARWRVMNLENKLYQLLNTLIASETDSANSLEASNVGGRWCIRSGVGQITNFKGLLLSSGGGMGNMIEPVSAVQLNDELLDAKSRVADAELEVLWEITEKIKGEIDGIEKLLKSIVELDVVNARASYGVSVGGTCPDLIRVDGSEDKRWMVRLTKAYHPLLLQRHRQNVQVARKNVANAKAEIRRRRLYGENTRQQGMSEEDMRLLQEKANQVENEAPVAADFVIEKGTRVVVISGANSGGKTISLKAVGVAAMMARSGVYVLCSEAACIPWFDFVLADIGDEQSLSHSLSTFSAHLTQITEIQGTCTRQSLVLLDEIGGGTNPIEGAALGMSILESFAEEALLTIATTHHSQLKTLKYSNPGFENACMEFDDVNLKPTYTLLWGVPGRSNAINIAQRLRLPKTIVDNARQLYGTATAQIDEVIFGLEKFKHDVEDDVHEAQQHLRLSNDLHLKLQLAQSKISDHVSDLRYRKIQEISELASVARSNLHMKMRQHRASASATAQLSRAGTSSPGAFVSNQQPAGDCSNVAKTTASVSSIGEVNQPVPGTERRASMPKIGDIVQVSSLGTKAKVLKVEPSKDEILVQVGNLKLKVKMSAVKT